MMCLLCVLCLCVSVYLCLCVHLSLCLSVSRCVSLCLYRVVSLCLCLSVSLPDSNRPGQVKLVLRDNKHHVETAHLDVMKILLTNKDVKACMVQEGGEDAGVKTSEVAVREAMFDEMEDEEDGADVKWDEKALDTAHTQVEHFVVDAGKYRDIKDVCFKQLGLPLIEEYDYKKDKRTLHGHPKAPTPFDKQPWQTGLDLKSASNVRDYQAKCLNKVFGSNGRARSGLIVLPCGAGKTFVGITAACTIKKTTVRAHLYGAFTYP